MIAGYIALNLVLIAMMVLARQALRRFLAQHARIGDAGGLDDFRTLARNNMRMALGYLVCGLAVLIWSGLLVVQQGLPGLLLVLTFTLPLLFLGVDTRKLEAKAQKLQCAPELDADYRRITEVWMKKALPDF